MLPASMLYWIAEEDLDPFEMRLYVHYLISAERRLPNTPASESAAKCRMSVKNMEKARNGLCKKGYISVNESQGHLSITLEDLDIRAYASLYPDKFLAAFPNADLDAILNRS